jgi:hypothetical protein
LIGAFDEMERLSEFDVSSLDSDEWLGQVDRFLNQFNFLEQGTNALDLDFSEWLNLPDGEGETGPANEQQTTNEINNGNEARAPGSEWVQARTDELKELVGNAEFQQYVYQQMNTDIEPCRVAVPGQWQDSSQLPQSVHALGAGPASPLALQAQASGVEDSVRDDNDVSRGTSTPRADADNSQYQHWPLNEPPLARYIRGLAAEYERERAQRQAERPQRRRRGRRR